MVSAIQSALSGLHTSSLRFNQAAADIVRSGSLSVSAVSPISAGPLSQDPSTATTSAPVPFDFTSLNTGEGPSLVDSLVALKAAEILYKASAKLLGALYRSENEVLKII